MHEGNLGYTNSIINYCTVYKDTYTFLFESIKKSSNKYDEFLEPMLFLLRHSIELGIKFNIQYLSIATKNKMEVSIGTEHNLKVLTEELGRLINLMKIGDDVLIRQIKGYYRTTKTLSDYLTKLDKNSTSFRYAVKSKLLKSKRLVNVNLTQITLQFDIVSSFLINTSDVLDPFFKIKQPYVDKKLKDIFRNSSIEN